MRRNEGQQGYLSTTVRKPHTPQPNCRLVEGLGIGGSKVTGASLLQPGLAQVEVEDEVEEDRDRLAESRARFEEPLPRGRALFLIEPEHRIERVRRQTPLCSASRPAFCAWRVT